MCFSRTLSPRLRTIIQIILNIVRPGTHGFSKRTYWKKKRQIGHNLVPTNKIFVAFSLCASQNKLKQRALWTKDKKARTTLESYHARKRPAKTPKMAHFLKGVKNGHFAKAIAKQNGHKWAILGLSRKIPKTYRNYPLKSLELFSAENCSKTHLILEKWLDVEKWQNWPFCKGHIVRQSGQKRFSLSWNFKES